MTRKELVITYNKDIYNAWRACLQAMNHLSFARRDVNEYKEFSRKEKAAIWVAYKFAFVAYRILDFAKTSTAKREIKIS